MKTSSAKAKGRRLCQEIKELLHKWAPDLKPGDIEVTSSSVTGEDLKLSPAAREIYPFVCECKCQEALNVWKSLEQAESHLADRNQDYGFYVPILFFRRNHSKTYVALEIENFMKLIR